MSKSAAILDAAAARRAAFGGQTQRSAADGAATAARPSGVPGGLARSTSHPAQLRASLVERGGKKYVRFVGEASTYERGYEMWDFFGPYTEVVSAGAGARSLAAGPDVAFLVNHRGLTMARTKSGTLELSETASGLQSTAWCNPKRTDVSDLSAAIDDGDVTEMSFAFTIERGSWSPDYTEFRIDEYNIDRGDVSAVNYGANPNTSIEARSSELLSLLQGLDGAAARAARDMLAARTAPHRRYGRLAADLGGVRARLDARALTPADTKTLSALLVQLAAADAALDPIVEALCGADCALDVATMTLASMLGIPELDPEDDSGDMVDMAGAPMSGEAAAPKAGLSIRLAENLLTH